MDDQTSRPLAEKMRPTSLSQVVGQKHIIGKGRLLHDTLTVDDVKSMIFWGPPGVGKTTVARLVSQQIDADFYELSAVSAGKADVRRVVTAAHDMRRLGRATVLFIDELHRFNKAQQDFLLPSVEDGTLIFIGATTENPSFEVITPLLSRTQLVVFKPIGKDDIITLLQQSVPYLRGRTLAAPQMAQIAQLAAGDARQALTLLDTAIGLTKKAITSAVIKRALEHAGQRYDQRGEEHYATISAYIKSMRGSDVDASLLYLHKMLISGEDPLFVARRLLIFASEDVGMAAPYALTLAVAVFQTVERIGMPEAGYALTHGTIALASAKKSRAVARAMEGASQAVKDNPQFLVPLHLRNSVTPLMEQLGYQKDYAWEAGYQPPQGFMPEGLEDSSFYQPGSTGATD